MDDATGQKIDEAKDEVKKTVIKWSLGLQGIWAQGANLTAVFLICFLFYQYQSAFLAQAREDRSIVREELNKMHEANQKQWQAIKENQGTLEQLLREVAVLAQKK
jgi:hypothetical protein